MNEELDSTEEQTPVISSDPLLEEEDPNETITLPEKNDLYEVFDENSDNLLWP